MSRLALAALGALSSFAACSTRSCTATAQEEAPRPLSQDAPMRIEIPARTPDVIYVPTPPERVKAMLELAEVKRGEKLYDLGCGDGRIPVAAARDHGARAVCVDIDPQRIREARANVEAAGVGHLVEVREADLFEIDFSDADVVTLYLLPTLNERLRPRLQRELRNGARVVSHSFDMGTAWVPDATREVTGSKIFLWRIRK